MKLKKLTVLLLVLVLALNICGCNKTSVDNSEVSSTTSDQTKGKDYITLLYSAADTFNPYTAKTDINRQLCQLLYEPLLTLDNELNTVYKIAKSVKVSGKSCTVTLNNIRFSDGSMLTAQDVVYSCNLAKKSGGVYATSLYEVKSVKEENSNEVIFNLTKVDPYFANNLTFPIIKKGSEKITDSDSVLQPPVGSGKYKVSDDKLSLVINENYYSKHGNIKNIKLINAPDMESVSHYIEVGAADMYYSSISDGNILRMSGKKLDITLNSMLYIGINQNYSLLAQNELRQALSSGIDREKICQNAYYNNAVSANGFFNPVWKETKSVQNIQIEANSQITVENLEKIGYNKVDSKNYRINSSGNKINLTLLVNSENRLKAAAAHLIAAQLKSQGINVTVVEKTYAQYMDCLKKGNFQLFLGEIRLTDNMDISNMVTEGGSAAYGLKKTKAKKNAENKDSSEENSETVKEKNQNKSQEVLSGFYTGKNTIADVASVLQTEMPFIPVLYRTGILFCNDNIENVNNSSLSDIYASIESYIYN